MAEKAEAAIPLGYQTLDEEVHICEVNSDWLRAVGYQREEVIGRRFEGFLPAYEQDQDGVGLFARDNCCSASGGFA